MLCLRIFLVGSRDLSTTGIFQQQPIPGNRSLPDCAPQATCTAGAVFTCANKVGSSYAVYCWWVRLPWACSTHVPCCCPQPYGRCNETAAAPQADAQRQARAACPRLPFQGRERPGPAGSQPRRQHGLLLRTSQDTRHPAVCVHQCRCAALPADAQPCASRCLRTVARRNVPCKRSRHSCAAMRALHQTPRRLLLSTRSYLHRRSACVWRGHTRGGLLLG